MSLEIPKPHDAINFLEYKRKTESIVKCFFPNISLGSQWVISMENILSIILSVDFLPRSHRAGNAVPATFIKRRQIGKHSLRVVKYR